MHDRYQRRSPIDGRGKIGGIDATVGVNGQIRDAYAMQAGERRAELQYSRMLRRLGDDMVAALAQGQCDATNCQRVAFRAAAGKDYLVGCAAQHQRELPTRYLDRFALATAIIVLAGRIAKVG